jgi:DNA-binding CsgD family transcriptional regulator
LQELVSSYARRFGSPGSPGHELRVPRMPPNAPLHVTVTPLGLATRLTAVPWLGVGVPVAFVTVSDPGAERQRRQSELRQRYNLTGKEAALALEILKGDGRAAAARRCNISDMTAKTYLANIFDKTETHRQAELVHLLLEDEAARTVSSGYAATNSKSPSSSVK